MVAQNKDIPAIPNQSPGSSPRYLTREEAADLLGVVQGTLIAYEKKKKICAYWMPRIDHGGRLIQSPLYLIEDVLKLPRKAPAPSADNPDELCARAFELFDTGKSLRECVILLRASADKVKAIYDQWADLGGVDMAISAVVRERLAKTIGAFQSAEHLAEIIEERISGKAIR